MLRGFVRGGGYPWPCGVYFKDGPYANVMMAADVDFTPQGLTGRIPAGDTEDMAALQDSYIHLCAMRDEIIESGLLPPVSEWRSVNSNL
jgi:malate dehydrogenase